MATKGEKALANVVRELKKGIKKKEKASDIAASAWPAFAEAVAIAASELRSEELRAATRWRREKGRSTEEAQSLPSSEASAN